MSIEHTMVHEKKKYAKTKTSIVRQVLLHLECHSISDSQLNPIGLFSTERGQRGLENQVID